MVQTVIAIVPHKDEYKKRLLNELQKYSFEPREKGTPANWGCVHELTDITHVKFENPEEFGKFVKEWIHLMYQKATAKRVFDALLAELE